MRIVSYNIRKAVGADRIRSPDRILAVLSELGGDVVVLQEADRRVGARASALPMELIADTRWRIVPIAVRPASIGWHGNAVLIPRGAEILDMERIELPTLEPRGAVLAEVRLGAKMLRIVGMHLDLSGLRRRRQVEQILHRCRARSPMATVLTGDTNEWSHAGGCIPNFMRDHHQLPTAASFPARMPIARLDRIFHDPSLRPLGCGTHHSLLARTASDHLPVWADFAWHDAPVGGGPLKEAMNDQTTNQERG